MFRVNDRLGLALGVRAGVSRGWTGVEAGARARASSLG